MASTAASASEVEGQIVGLYAAQVNNQYVSAAVACWFLWDHVITLDQEIKLIWGPRQWNAITIPFVFIRYGISIGYPLGLYATFTRANEKKICPYSDTILVLSAILGHAIQLVLGLRVWALYNRSRRIGVFLLLLFLALLAVSFNLVISYLMGGKSPLPSVTPGSAQLFGCLMNPIPGYYRTLVATTVFETVIVCMTIWKVVMQMRGYRSIPLVNYILSTGVVYYVAMLAMLIINLLTEPFPVLEIPVLSSSCILVVQGVACCHIVLGMLRQGEKSVHHFPPRPTRRPEEAQTTSSFFNIPTGVYPKEVLENWEFGLPPMEMDGLVEGDEDAGIAMGPISASAGPLDV